MTQRLKDVPVIMAITSHWLPSPISSAHKKQRQRNTYSITALNSNSVHPSSLLGDYQQPWGSREDMMVETNISPNMQGEGYLAHHSLLLMLQFFFSMIFILFSILTIFFKVEIPMFTYQFWPPYSPLGFHLRTIIRVTKLGIKSEENLFTCL